MSKTKFVITFGSLEDFTDEVLHRNVHTVHLFSGIRDESAGKGAPSLWRRYLVILTVRDGDDILVCQISVGGQWAIFARDPAGLVHSDNLVIAEKLVRAYLIMHGLEVRPGMYALDYKNLITASARLWRFDGDKGEDKRLVPRWAGFPQWPGKNHDVLDVIEVGQLKPTDITPAMIGEKYVEVVRQNIEWYKVCRIVWANITAIDDSVSFYFEACDGIDVDPENAWWGYPYDPVTSTDDDGEVRGFFGPCPTVQDAIEAAHLVFDAWRLAQDHKPETQTLTLGQLLGEDQADNPGEEVA